jgi:hypothetical protein
VNCSVHGLEQFRADEANGVALAGAAGPDDVCTDQVRDEPGPADEVLDERLLACAIQADGLDGHALDEIASAALLRLGNASKTAATIIADDSAANAVLDCEKRHAQMVWNHVPKSSPARRFRTPVPA